MQTCLARSKGGLGSSAGYRPSMPDAGGIMSGNATQNPHFFNWTKVFVKYCDGSSMTSAATHTGTGAATGHGSGSGRGLAGAAPLHFRGRANLDAVLDTLALRAGGTRAVLPLG